MIEVDYLNLCTCYQIRVKLEVYKFVYLCSNSEVIYIHLISNFLSILKVDFEFDVFKFKLRSIHEVDFLSLCIQLKLKSILEVDFLNDVFLFKLVSLLKVYFIFSKVNFVFFFCFCTSFIFLLVKFTKTYSIGLPRSEVHRKYLKIIFQVSFFCKHYLDLCI